MHARTRSMWLVAVVAVAASLLFATDDLTAGQSQSQPTSTLKQLPFEQTALALADATRKKAEVRFQLPLPPSRTRGGGKLSIGPDPKANQDTFAEDVLLALNFLNTYWSEAIPTYLRKPYRPLAAIYQYEPTSLNKGFPCYGKYPEPNNAFYCGDVHGIQWHGQWLYDKYVKQGDFAMMVIIAHEWGHMVQAHMSTRLAFTIERELQADCLAGVWTKWAEPRILEVNDLKEAVDGLIGIADAKSPWLNPDGHGSADQRVASFWSGYRSPLPATCKVQ